MEIRPQLNVVFLSISIIFLLLIPTGRPAFAVPASPELKTLTNPDGTRFKARIRGDEFRNWIETENGYSVVRNRASEYWEYAEKGSDGKLRNSGVVFRPGETTPSKSPKGLRPDKNAAAEAGLERMIKQIYKGRRSSASPDGASAAAPEKASGDWVPAPVSGTRNMLVILINFADRKLVTSPNGWYAAVFDTSPGVKSMTNYYAENSYGTLAVSPAAHTQESSPAGIVTVAISDNHPNCGGEVDYDTETTILTHALSQAAQYLDFASFDTNRNGEVEQSELSVYFIYAGYEASGSNKTPSIWAHAWGGYPGLSVAGKNITGWAQNGELNDDGAQHPMGVIAHEMGHALCGLPDLYDTTYTNAGLGIFSLMSAGSWGADTNEYYGTTPVCMDAWSRQYLGWAAPVTPSSGDTMTLPLPLSGPASSYRLVNPSVTDTEYFLAENRYPVGWDAGMKIQLGNDWPGGLLILHVDITSGTQGSNDINEYGAGQHQGVMAEEADSSRCSLVNGSCGGSPETLFYSGNNDAFGDSSYPSSDYYSGVSSGVEISSISAPGETMLAACFAGATTEQSSISSIFPVDNATGISTRTRISVSFSGDMDKSTINSSTFLLSQGMERVPGTVSYDAEARTATFAPSYQLYAGTKYTATVTTGILDRDGKPVSGGKSWSFTTRRWGRF